MNRSFVAAAVVLTTAACASKPDARTDSAAPDSLSAPAVSTATPGTPAATTTPGSTAPPGTPSSPNSMKAAPGAPGQAVMEDIPPEDLVPVVAPTLAQVDTTITLRAQGADLVFDPATITLKQGTRVRIRFQNMGTFAHNFVIMRNEDDIDELAARAHDAREQVPMSLKSKMLAWTNMAQTSQTVEMGFVVPPPGDYVYVCFVEGHANTMRGRLRSLP